MKSINSEAISGKTVIVRADFDVPVKDGVVEDSTRIEKTIPTLKLLLEKGNKLFIISHLGRPEGKDPAFSLKLTLPKLKELFAREVAFQEDLEKKAEGEVVLLENLRFWKAEEANDDLFAKKLASFGEVFVFDCFSVAHRSHASVVGIPKQLPSYAGIEISHEVEELSKIFKNPEHPLIAIIGGAKLETKLPAITNLAKVADKVLVGGKLMFEVENVELPQNVLVASDNVDGKDIGEESIETFAKEINSAKMIVWNGPMGVFEEEKYAVGTKKVAELVANSESYSLVGGGDTISALKEINMIEKINFVSVGGGAMLEFLEAKRLPGLEALGYYE
ncbi:MAG TPA: phosphoglycerate kinase [Candidatus Saccharimonadales bacterium]|nr:phosphoglycerate kinase [Candidatus Saccharimonadales bacterium]